MPLPSTSSRKTRGIFSNLFRTETQLFLFDLCAIPPPVLEACNAKRFSAVACGRSVSQIADNLDLRHYESSEGYMTRPALGKGRLGLAGLMLYPCALPPQPLQAGSQQT